MSTLIYSVCSEVAVTPARWPERAPTPTPLPRIRRGEDTLGSRLGWRLEDEQGTSKVVETEVAKLEGRCRYA